VKPVPPIGGTFLKNEMEEIAKTATLYISNSLEVIAAMIIGTSVLKLLYQYLSFYFEKEVFKKPPHRGGLEGLRVTFGSAVAVSLELLLGADVLETAVAPSWDDIGKLAAIATIRTVLNYFLERELSKGLSQGVLPDLSEKHSKSPA
jgi:uncharacterized membrane protein